MSEITPEALSDWLYGSDESPRIVDIRPESEFGEWHVPRSENVPVSEELKHDPEAATAALSEVPTDKPVVTVCAAGVLSEEATARLEELGHDATTLRDGMNGWSRVHRSAPVEAAIDGTLVQVARPGKGCLSHVLVSGGEAAVFDPSQYVEHYDEVLETYDADLIGVFDTHAHADHVSGGRDLAARHDVPYHLHPGDATNLDAAPVTDGDRFEVGDVEVRVIHTPGHSPGSVTFAVDDEALLTGDTLFHESVGRVELGVEAGVEAASVRENAATLYRSLQRLRDRAGDPLVLPAHDPGSPDPPVTARLSDVVDRNEDLGRQREAFVADLAATVADHPPNFQRVKQVNLGETEVDDEERSTLELGPNRCAAD